LVFDGKVSKGFSAGERERDRETWVSSYHIKSWDNEGEK